MSLGFYFDNSRCVGCKACQIACKDRFDMQMAGPRPRRVHSFECGTYPDTGIHHVSISCNHCEAPACVANCPTGAMYKDVESGVVLHDDDVCIGCQTCVNSCPYDAPQYVEDWNMVVKCDTCKALRDGGMNPVCVDACGMRALDFGDMDELRVKYGEECVSEMLCTPEASITTPNVLIKLKDYATVEPFREVRL